MVEAGCLMTSINWVINSPDDVPGEGVAKGLKGSNDLKKYPTMIIIDTGTR